MPLLTGEENILNLSMQNLYLMYEAFESAKSLKCFLILGSSVVKNVQCCRHGAEQKGVI